MNILIAGSYYKPNFGGVENSIFELSQDFNKKNLKVFIMSSDRDENDNKLKNTEIIDNIPVYRFKKTISKKIPWIIKFFIDAYSANKKILKIKKKHQIDLVISRSVLISFACLFIRKKLYKIFIPPTTAYFENIYYKINHRNKLKILIGNIYLYFQLLIELSVLINSDIVIVFSKLVKKKLILNNLFSKINIIPPGVNTDFYHPYDLKLKKKLRSNYSFSEKDKIFLILGRINDQKNINELLFHFSKIKNNSIKILIVGDGPSKKDLSYKYGKIKNIIFLEKSNKAYDFYNLSDFFIMSSNFEPFGQTIIEAMACGLPILSIENNLVASKEIIQENINGFFFSKDFHNFEKTLTKMVNLSKDKFEAISKSNIYRVYKYYKWENLSEFILNNYDS